MLEPLHLCYTLSHARMSLSDGRATILHHEARILVEVAIDHERYEVLAGWVGGW
jgi:hypothetical protein